MIAKRACEIRAQDKHFCQAFEIKANVYKAECLCLQNGGFSGIQKASLTHQIWWESMQRGIGLLVWTDPGPALPSSQELQGGSTSIPLLRRGVRGTLGQ